MELRVSGRARGLQGTLQVPGDKSVTHRALLLGAMATGCSRLRRPLRAGVIEAMRSCLESLGAAVEIASTDETRIHGGRWRSPGRPLDCRNSGTTMRLLLGALAGSPVAATLTGTPRLSQRPMSRVVEPLRKMGAQIAGVNGGDQPPLRIVGSRLHGIEYELQVASAQVKTAILLAGLQAEGRTRIHEPIATRDHSERLLQHLGVSLAVSNRTLTLEPLHAPLPPFEVSIPGDISAAAFLLAAAVLAPGSQLRLRKVGLNPTRTGLLQTLRHMGAQLEFGLTGTLNGEPVGDIRAEFSGLRGMEIDQQQLVSMIDEVPILAVIATQAHGETIVRGAGELRSKESDRLSAMAVELRRMGARIEEFPDGLTITGPTALTGAQVSSHADHRVAMALIIAGALASGQTIVSGAEIMHESYPGFAGALRAMGVDVG